MTQNETLLLGIDIGTTGTKCAIYDLKGELVAHAYQEYSMIHPQPSWTEQDPHRSVSYTHLCIVVFSLLCGRFLISLLFYQRLFLSQERCDNRSDGGDIRFCAAKSKLIYLCISHK